MLEALELSKSYGKNKILNNVSLTAPPSSIVSVVGKNGSGKSTLLSILCGLQRQDGGTVLLNGAKMDKGAQKKISFVPQADNLFEELSVDDNLKFWAAAAKFGLKNIYSQDFVKVLELEDFKRKKVKTLSGGMKRRLSIAIGLLSNPEILVLDEPFSSLDLFYKLELTAFFEHLKKMGKTIIFSSHSTEDIVRLSDFMYLLNAGVISLKADKDYLAANKDNIGTIILRHSQLPTA